MKEKSLSSYINFLYDSFHQIFPYFFVVMYTLLLQSVGSQVYIIRYALKSDVFLWLNSLLIWFLVFTIYYHVVTHCVYQFHRHKSIFIKSIN